MYLHLVLNVTTLGPKCNNTWTGVGKTKTG